METSNAADLAATPGGRSNEIPPSGEVDDKDVTAVARAFASVLDLKSSVAPDDDFFHLGADSLSAAALMVEIEREHGVRMSISVLIEASTPRTLASAIVAARDVRRVRSVLVPAKVTGGGTPLFCVHGLRGESTFPLRISRNLKSDRPLYGFRALGLEANELPLSTVAAMATHYLATARTVQPTGPYLLSGHCAGALVAYEMAQQLSAAGEATAGLMLIDPPTHHSYAPFIYNSGPALAHRHQILKSRAAQVEAAFANSSQMTVELRRAGVLELVRTAVARYVPAPLKAHTLLITSWERKDPLRTAYAPLLSDCEFAVIKADHKKLFKDHLNEIVERIDSFVDRVAMMVVGSLAAPGLLAPLESAWTMQAIAA